MSKITIELNGQKKEVNSNSTIQDILDEIEIKNKMFVVEKNLEIVQKEEYNSIVKDADKIGIVSFFGGG